MFLCPTEGCGRPSRATTKASLCVRCRGAKHQGRTVGQFGKRVAHLLCTVNGCERTQYAKDLCNMHYQRTRLFGFTGSAESMRVMWRDLGIDGRPEFLSNRDFDVPDSLEGIIERAEYEKILREDPCVFCGAKTTDIDHIEPFARGGSSEWDNLAATCRSCNSKKFTWSLLDFLLLTRERSVA